MLKNLKELLISSVLLSKGRVFLVVRHTSAVEKNNLITMFASSVRRAAMATTRRSHGVFASASQQQSRGMANLPFGLDKILGVGAQPDNLIPTDRERKSKPGYIPDFAPADLRKEMEELGIDGVEELDELEEKNMQGYNELGLVPPEGAGTFASPILIPSRMDNRVVGYSDPATHTLYWFTIHNDSNTYYIKDLGLFFKMLHIPDDDASGH